VGRADGDGTQGYWAHRRVRTLERALAHPWREGAKFGAAYIAGISVVQVGSGLFVAALVPDVIVGAIMTVFIGLSMRGGYHRRNYQRRLDRLRGLMAAPPVGWYSDPAERHEFRFWNGRRWTDFALDNGVQCADPLPEP
jgi:hypothetical protein